MCNLYEYDMRPEIMPMVKDRLGGTNRLDVPVLISVAEGLHSRGWRQAACHEERQSPPPLLRGRPEKS